MWIYLFACVTCINIYSTHTHIYIYIYIWCATCSIHKYLKYICYLLLKTIPGWTVGKCLELRLKLLKLLWEQPILEIRKAARPHHECGWKIAVLLGHKNSRNQENHQIFCCCCCSTPPQFTLKHKGSKWIFPISEQYHNYLPAQVPEKSLSPTTMNPLHRSGPFPTSVCLWPVIWVTICFESPFHPIRMASPSWAVQHSRGETQNKSWELLEEETLMGKLEGGKWDCQVWRNKHGWC